MPPVAAEVLSNRLRQTKAFPELLERASKSAMEMPNIGELLGRNGSRCTDSFSMIDFVVNNTAITSTNFSNKGLNKNIFSRINDTIQEMQIALSDMPENVANKIRYTGDLYTYDELSAIQKLLYNRPEISVSDALRCRGNAAKIDLATQTVHFRNYAEFKKELDEYVNSLVKFKTRDPYSLQARVNRIDNGIAMYGIKPNQTLYRGELSDTVICRLLHMAEFKRLNKDSKVIYYPERLHSASKSKSAITDIGNYARKCLIEIDATSGTNKAIDINNCLGSKNDFAWQEEMLFGSKTPFEILGSQMDGEIPVIKMLLL